MATLAERLQSFFTERLMTERAASPNTVASYSDTLRLLLSFLADKLGKDPTQIELEELNAKSICEFLRYLEDERGNCPRTRNTRLAAICSFFRYLSFQEPQLLGQIQQVLAIPTKRFEPKPIDYLEREEVEAILAAIDTQTWAGLRDLALLALLVHTGLRVSEALKLRCEDVVLGKGAHVHCEGKGRRKRCVPLRKSLAEALGRWLELHNAGPSDPLFVNARGGSLSRDGVAYLLDKYVALASQQCPSLAAKRVTPHVLRHTMAMEMLDSGIDRNTMALCLGHASSQSTQCYLHASLRLKQRALDKTQPWDLPPGRYRAPDRILSFLKGLSQIMPSQPGPTTSNPATTGGPG